jgi:outer membrane protein assembly factor BamB
MLLRSSLACLALVASGCAVDASSTTTTPSETRIASATQALGEGSFLYLRCNATGWGVDANTRLLTTGTPGVYELLFDVKESYMLNGGDDCVITETPVEDGWGSWQKYYAPSWGTLEAPAAISFTQEFTADVRNFKVKYKELGRHRAIVNTLEGYVSIARAGDLKGGDVLWSSAGNYSSDAKGTLYRVSAAGISRVDGATSLPQWTVATDGYGYLDPSCSGADLALVRSGSTPTITGLDAATGATRWTVNLGAEVGSSWFQIECDIARDALFVASGATNELFAFRRSSGQRLWSSSASGGLRYAGSAANYTLAVASGNTTPALIAFDDRGTPAWILAGTEGSWLTTALDAAGRLYVNDGTVRRLDASTGKVLWKAEAAEGESFAYYNGAPYRRGAGFLTRLDGETGAAQWTFAPAEYAGNWVDPVLAADGTLYSSLSTWRPCESTNPYECADTTVYALDAGTGAQRWRATYAQNGRVWTDARGGAYFSKQYEFSALDTATGAVRWTVQNPAATPSGYYGGFWSSIVDVDANGVYLQFYGPGYRYALSGLMAVNPSSGAVRWSKYDGSWGYYAFASDAQRIFATKSRYRESAGTVAILK